jgi:hypothetical protein
MMRMLEPNPNLKFGKQVAHDIYDLAQGILVEVKTDSPEITAGLRKLLEAKDCLVRAAVFEAMDETPVDYRDR